MNAKRIQISILVMLLFIILIGCSKNSSSPVTPDNNGNQTQVSSELQSGGNLMLGLWDCALKPGDDEFQIVPLRTTEITLNINKFLNNSVGGFTINELDLSGLSTGRIDCTIAIKHPLAGLDQFDIFDVWGVFLHNGATHLFSDDLGNPTYSGGPEAGENEALLLNADGYTRWFNKPEFDGDGPAFLEYYPLGFSNLESPTACVNPYKIFADSLLKDDDYYNWITDPGNADQRNIFRAGVTNSRRYEIQFPVIGGTPVVQFQFAVIGNWEPGDPTLTGDPAHYDPWDFPSSANVEEPFFVHVSTEESTMYYDESYDPPKSGGDLVAEIEIFDWQGGETELNGVLNEIEELDIEHHNADDGGWWMSFIHPYIEPLASPGTENSSVVQVEIPDLQSFSAGDYEIWIIIQSAGLRGDSYDQGVPTQYPDGVRRSAYIRGTVYVSPVAPFENTPPVITGIEDDIVGPGAYKNPVSADDTSVTYSPIFTDPDTGQTHEFVWWIVDDGAVPYPGGIVNMPIDWSTYIPGEYDIFVTVDDGYGPVQGGPYDITLEETVTPVWSDPYVIDFQACMPRAVENWDGDLVLIYYSEDNGIKYSVRGGLGWTTPDTAYYWTDGIDKQTEPTYLSITRGEFGHIVYGSFQGWAGDENSFANTDRHAIKWDGEAWDYTYLWGSTYLDTLMLPDDDDSFLNVYTVRLLGDPGPLLRGADRAYWGQQDQDPDLLPVLDEAICATSNCNAAVRDDTYHYVAYRQWGYNVAAKLTRVSKSNVLDNQNFTIYQAAPGEMVDSVALAMDSSGTLHAAWRVSTNDTMWIDYAKSTDNGETWTTAQPVYKIDNIWQGFLENYIGIVTDSHNKIYITFTQDTYIYMCKSSDGILWAAPDSFYTGPLPLGFHLTQPYPVMTSDNILHIFYVSKNDQFQFGGLIEVTYY